MVTRQGSGDRRRDNVTISHLQAIVGLTIAVLSLVGMLAGGYRWFRGHVQEEEAHQRGERALCDRIEQVAATFVKYYPAETSALYYPNSKECP